MAEPSYMDEADELLQLITPPPSAATPPDVYLRIQRRFHTVLDKYQEQPQLLDPHLGTLVPPLFAGLGPAMAAAASSGSRLSSPGHALCHILYLFTKVRGPETLLRFFPHSVSDVERTLAVLHVEAAAAAAAAPDAVWETRYVLLLWASLLIMVPFALDTIDSSVSGSVLVDDLMALAKVTLADSARTSEAAALVLAKMLSRRDLVAGYLAPFLEWARGVLVDPDSAPRLVCGVLNALTEVFKRGLRSDLLPVVGVVYSAAIAVAEAADATQVRHYSTRLVQRIGLVYLKPTVATWRYQRGGRVSIRDTLATSDTPATPAVAPSAPAPAPTPAPALAPATPDVATSEAAEPGSGSDSDSDSDYDYDYDSDDDDDDDVPEPVDAVIHVLLMGLRARETVVRWSAAKGIGRMTERLPQEFADDVVSSILSLLTSSQSDSAWHGGCLALAELARRGLLLPSVLPTVLDKVLAALTFDELRGSHSVGSHVRDAGCYVAWAFARAYDAAIMAPHALPLARGLILMAIFDREVNCRRAASAAFQELAGRLGNIPHGIAILTAADYFAVGNMTHAYLELSVFVAGFDEYRDAVVDHLTRVCTVHWDKDVRALAARAVAALFPVAPQFFVGSATPSWMDATQSRTLAVRHGSLLALGHGLAAGYPVGAYPGDSAFAPAFLVSLLDDYTAARRFKGIGGQVTREACVTLLGLAGDAAVPFSQPEAERAHAFLLESLRHPDVVDATVEALAKFGACYYDADSSGLTLSAVAAQHVAVVRKGVEIETTLTGIVAALGTLPLSQDSLADPAALPTVFAVVDTLMDAALGRLPNMAAPTRSKAMAAVTRVVEGTQLIAAAAAPQAEPSLANAGSRVLEGLLMGLDDYSRTKQGDVGSWVRMGAMTALRGAARQVLTATQTGSGSDACSSAVWTSSVATDVLTKITRQSVEKIDRVRECASDVLRALMAMPGLPHCEELLETLAGVLGGPDAHDGGPAEAFAFADAAPLLGSAVFALPVMTGLVVSVGDLAESVAKAASAALLGYISSSEDGGASVVELLLQVMAAHHGDPRITIPGLKTLDTLFTARVMDAHGPPTSDLADRVFTAARAEILGSRDLVKLLTAAPVFASLLMYGVGELATRALRVLVSFLGHPYPKLRKEAADQLYLGLNTYEDHLPEDEDDADDLLDLLAETAWDGDRRAAMAARSPLYDAFGIPKPKPRDRKAASGAGSSSKPSGPQAKTSHDGATGTYSDLVRMSGF